MVGAATDDFSFCQPVRSEDLSQCVNEWYAQFARENSERLFDLLNAGNYLDMRPLLLLSAAAISAKHKNMKKEQIVESFGFKMEDFSEEAKRLGKIKMDLHLNRAPPPTAEEINV